MLVDSNIIIYAGKPGYDHIRRFIAIYAPFVSAISYVEVLGYHSLTNNEKQIYEDFFAAATHIPIDEDVIRQATLLRQQRKMSLGDALIAATALLHGQMLATRNTKDFAWIPSLALINPFDDE